MFNIRTLFNMRRFAGCQNPRRHFATFAEDSERPLSLRCEETPAGGAQLVLDDAGQRLLPQAFPLPAHVHERCDFWNRWVSHALETEWEHPISPYGPESYATAIAIDIAAACPDRPVDWCGLPVHDDYNVLQYLKSQSLQLKDYQQFPILPISDLQNHYTRHLLQDSAVHTLTFRGLKGRFIDYYDEGLMWYDYACEVPPHYPDDTSLYCPDWLEEQIDRCGMCYGYDISREHYNWTPCELLHNFRADAIGIDIMRYHPHHVAVCSSPYYIARPEDFPPLG